MIKANTPAISRKQANPASTLRRMESVNIRRNARWILPYGHYANSLPGEKNPPFQ